MRRLKPAATACSLWLLLTAQPSDAEDKTIVCRDRGTTAKFEKDNAEYQKQKAGRDEEFAKLEAEGLLPSVKGAPQSEREWSKLTPEERDDLRLELSKTREALEEMAKAKADKGR